VVQPRNLDTGPGLLLPLARILARDPDGRVVFLPSDHYMSADAPLVAAIRDVSARQYVTLIGVTPTGPEIEYGWIVRGRRIGRSRAFAVKQFHEKPAESLADQLWSSGGLWNTFISSGTVRAFWELAHRHLPVHAELFTRYATAVGQRDEVLALDHTYDQMQPANFSRDVLANSRELAVTPIAGTGWSDWGSPQRVFQSLVGTPELERLVRRIREPFAFAC
jgi:mannose-1-phosphate guanylyltransferase